MSSTKDAYQRFYGDLLCPYKGITNNGLLAKLWRPKL